MLDTDVNDLEQIEMSIANAKHIIERGQAIERLENNEDFKKLITDDYLSANVIRLVNFKADASQQSQADQECIEKQLSAIAFFNQFILYLKTAGCHAQLALDRDKEEREQILAGGN
ncbi:MAG: hypothetical protein U9O94_05595 [Nanoarchaeota archaeon]|nr:hypothetical protein [Nanoarchaeota archaeon]